MRGITPLFIILILGLVALISSAQLEQIIGLLTGENTRLDLTARKMRDQIQNEAFVTIPGNYYVLIGPCSGISYTANDGWEVPQDIKEKINELCFGSHGVVCVMIPRFTTALSGCTALATTKPDQTVFLAPIGFTRTAKINLNDETISLTGY
ncbi:MAG: hypothetical protein GOU99_00830 [Candidatus Altiarchaeota archaeon]|nr:hypothetical protein [Candidatus Altiarchaeota archaeon]